MIRLLYLEDDEALAFVTSRALSKKGFKVLHFADLANLRSQLGTLEFDAALLDLKIGSNTSLEVLTVVVAERNIPVVVLTGYGTIRTAVQAMKLGAVDFLSKPCSVEEIITAFNNHRPVSPRAEIESEELKPPSLKNMEWEAIQKALDDNNGNISAAARQLKLHRRTLQRKLQKRHSELDD